MTKTLLLSSPLGSGRSAIDTGRAMRLLLVVGIAASLVACASSSRRPAARPGAAPAWESDGPGLSPPADLASIPDAEPTAEPMRSGPMRPYVVMGRSYTPITEDVPLVERGLASWYGRKFHGRSTASGEPYDMYAMTAAHPTLPLPSYVRVRNPANQREVIVRVNDRGPFHPGRIIDLSYTAAWKLDLLRGVAPVEIERFTNSAIVAGSWRRGAQTGVAVAAAKPVMQPAPLLGPLPAPLPVAAPLPIAAPAPSTVAALPAADPGPSQPQPVPDEVSAYWVQLGAFRFRDGAENFQRQIVADLGWIASALSVRSDAELHRLQAGPYTDRDEAAGVAQRLRESLQLVPVIVERR